MPRIVPLLGALMLMAAACGPGDVEFGAVDPEDLGFIVQVVDATADAGAGLGLSADADGNPHLSYLIFERPPAPGEPPPGFEIGVPERPTVGHAHLVGGTWTRSPVAAGVDVKPEDETAIFIDGEGTHHVAWSQGDAIFYSSNAGGEFSEGERVAGGFSSGLSITADAQGNPRIAFYEEAGDPEGPAALVRVAALERGDWAVDTAAEATFQQPATTGVGVAGDQVLVAYGDAGQTMLARSEGEVFRSKVADEDGGLGVSLAQDADGNPHLAYYRSDGQVWHAHSVGGSPWEPSQVGDAGGAPEADWVTSIDLSDQGLHHVAWRRSDGVGYANNADGSFAEEEVPADEAALRPRVGAGPEEAAYVAWYDSEDLQLLMAGRAAEEPLLAAPPPEDGEPQPGPTDGADGGPPPCEPDGTDLAIVAPVGAAVDGFAEDCLAAPAGEAFTIEFSNDDQGVPHNVAIYRTDAATEDFFVGEVFQGVDTMTYEPGAIDDTGQFFFRCDVHPTTMTGTFVVQ